MKKGEQDPKPNEITQKDSEDANKEGTGFHDSQEPANEEDCAIAIRFKEGVFPALLPEEILHEDKAKEASLLVQLTDIFTKSEKQDTHVFIKSQKRLYDFLRQFPRGGDRSRQSCRPAGAKVKRGMDTKFVEIEFHWGH